jgi:hypothetical protein
MDGDGNTDWVVFNSKTRKVSAWLMNGTVWSGTTLSGTNVVPAGKTVAAVEDLNGDGKADLILFQAANKPLTYWLMDGVKVTGTVTGPVVPIGFTAVAGADDLNGDGVPDVLLWNSTTRKTMVLALSGSNAQFGTPIVGPTFNKGLQSIGLDDFNGDDGAEWLTYNPATSSVQYWGVSGTTQQLKPPATLLPKGMTPAGVR